MAMSLSCRHAVMTIPRCLGSSSRLAFSSTSRCCDVMAELDKQLNPRELIERKRRVFEEKYGDKLRRRIEA